MSTNPAATITFPGLTTPVGPIGLGLMNMTWTATPTPDSIAFETIRTALETGASYLNSADFYGPPTEPTANISLLSRFFAAHPHLRASSVVGIKGGVNPATLAPDNSPTTLSASIATILSILGENRPENIIFIPARADPKTPVETVIAHLATHVAKGDIQGIGLSECAATTIRRAAAVHTISVIEIELSLISQESLSNGVADTAAELGIPITAYSPLGRGLLAGRFTGQTKLAEGDIRGWFERFQGENFEANVKLGEEVGRIAGREGKKVGGVLVGWVRSQERGRKGLVVVPIPGATRRERVLENLEIVEVGRELAEELERVVREVGVRGGRYNKHSEGTLYQ